MIEEVGREVTQSIVDNINTWIYMRVNHPETAQHVEDTSPLVTVNQPLLNLGGGITIRPTKDKMVPAHRVLKLAAREFYMRSDGKLYKGITEPVPPLYVNVDFPAIKVVDEEPATVNAEAKQEDTYA